MTTEEPKTVGFGAAGLSLAPFFRMRTAANGQAPGESARFPMRFGMPRRPELDGTAPRRAAAATAVAMRYLKASGFDSALLQANVRRIETLTRNVRPEMPETVLTTAAEALKAASAAMGAQDSRSLGQGSRSTGGRGRSGHVGQGVLGPGGRCLALCPTGHEGGF